MKRRKKQYYSIGEVCDMFEVTSHTLRYWEKEFPQLKPLKKNRKRVYRCVDLEMVKAIKTLLYDQGFTIKGAQKALEMHAEPIEVMAPTLPKAEIGSFRDYVKKELIEIKQMLEEFSS